MEKDELLQREEEIVARALKLQQDLSALHKAKTDSLARQLRQQLQQEATDQLARYQTQLDQETEAAVSKVNQEKLRRREALAQTQKEVAEKIQELMQKQQELKNAEEELEQSAGAAEAYVRAEAMEKLGLLEQQLARHMEGRIHAFLAALPSA